MSLLAYQFVSNTCGTQCRRSSSGAVSLKIGLGSLAIFVTVGTDRGVYMKYSADRDCGKKITKPIVCISSSKNLFSNQISFDALN